MNGEQLKAWRAERLLSQDKASKLIGVGRATIQNWERKPDKDVPKWAALAISAINRRLAPFPGKKRD